MDSWVKHNNRLHWLQLLDFHLFISFLKTTCSCALEELWEIDILQKWSSVSAPPNLEIPIFWTYLEWRKAVVGSLRNMPTARRTLWLTSKSVKLSRVSSSKRNKWISLYSDQHVSRSLGCTGKNKSPKRNVSGDLWGANAAVEIVY